MLDIPSISAIVAAVGVIIGVVFAVLELIDLVRARQTDLVMRLYSTYSSKEFLEAYTEFMTMEFETTTTTKKSMLLQGFLKNQKP